MRDVERINHQVQIFRESLNLLCGAFLCHFPEGFRFDPDAPVGDGSTGDEPMRSIGSRLCDVMETHDKLQEALGLPCWEEPRFRQTVAIGGR